MSGTKCSLDPADHDFRYWSSRPSLSLSTREAVEATHILLVPYEGFRDYGGPVYPVGTEELYNNLRENSAGMRVELAVEDEDYKEIAIHGDIVRIADFLVTYVVAPVAAGLIVEYLKKQLGSRFLRAEVHASMIVDQSNDKERKAFRLSYEGPAPTFERSLQAALKTLKQRNKAAKGPEPRASSKERPTKKKR